MSRSDPVPAIRADRGLLEREDRPALGVQLPRRRRAPYPVSPTIGPDGMRACQEIIEAARGLFVERGYYGTSIQAIAEATGRSPTAFYQYFHSKQEVFRILFEDLGAELVEQFGSMPTLTEDPAGLADFQSWLEGLGTVLRQYSPVFTDWPLYTEGEPTVENPSEEYLRQLGAHLQARLELADTREFDTRVLSVSLISVVAWAHLVLDTRSEEPRRTPREKTLHDTLARIIHRAVFPAAHSPIPHAMAGYWHPVPRPDLPAGDGRTTPEPGLRKIVTARARPTIEKVLAAAVCAFEQRGLAGTSVNDIIARAGVAHGSFYQYWTDRSALFTTLAHRAAAQTCDHFDQFLTAGTGPDLEKWLDQWLQIVEQYGTIFHIWVYEIQETAPLWPLSRTLRTYLDSIIAQVPRRWPAATPLDTTTGTVTLWTLLTELPYNAWLRHAVLTREEVLSCQKLLLSRGFLGVPQHT